jgi:hypothetical protein
VILRLQSHGRARLGKVEVLLGSSNNKNKVRHGAEEGFPEFCEAKLRKIKTAERF